MLSSVRCSVVVPPIEDFYFTPHRGSFIGAHIVANILRGFGYRVQLFIFPNFRKKPKTIALPKELFYLKEYIVSKEFGPTSFFSSYKRFGPSYKEAASLILEGKPDMIFISCFAFCYANQTIALAEEIKKQNKKKKIFCGGAGVSVFPEYFENSGVFDVVLTGEAETSLPKVFGKERFDFLFTEIVKTRSSKNFDYYSTYLSRGCPKGCGFCSVALIHGKKLRFVSKDEFIFKIKSLSFNKRVFLNFEDDNILLKKDFFLEVIENIRELYLDILFSCENGIDYRELDHNLLKKLIFLGFRQFNFSIGNLNKNISLSQRRNIDIEKLKSLTHMLSYFNIPAIVYFISGFKGEKVEDALNNLLFLSKLGENIRVGLSLFYPVPGIKGFENKNIFYDTSPTLCCGTSLWPWNNSLTTEEMMTLFRLTRVVNLTKKSQLNPEEKELLQKSMREKKLYTLVKGKAHPVEVTNYSKEMVNLFFENFFDVSSHS